MEWEDDLSNNKVYIMFLKANSFTCNLLNRLLEKWVCFHCTIAGSHVNLSLKVVLIFQSFLILTDMLNGIKNGKKTSNNGKIIINGKK